MIGTGGIGTGAFFLLDGNSTLGREESRSGRFLDRRDYCKLHIVSHYVRALLGKDFHTIPIGLVGNDDAGKALLFEMEEAGIDLNYVKILDDVRTLFSFCFIYPDGSGGNLTTADSASSRVTPEYVERSRDVFKLYRGRGIALAVPEVPVNARLRILNLGTEYSFFRVASFTTGEMEEAVKRNALSAIDLVALNIDEAWMIAFLLQNKKDDGPLSKDSLKKESEKAEVAEKAIELIYKNYPSLLVTVTAGKNGSWGWDGERLTHFPAVEVDAVSTAGAGDAFLAGIIAGIVAGLKVSEAQELATLVASLSVTSPHTIYREIDRSLLRRFRLDKGVPLSERVRELIM